MTAKTKTQLNKLMMTTTVHVWKHSRTEAEGKNLTRAPLCRVQQFSAVLISCFMHHNTYDTY